MPKNALCKKEKEVQTIDSREVAEMVGKEHKNLLADIRGYIKEIEIAVENGELKVQPSDFFVPSTYINTQNKELPCYDCTKMGCEVVANKLQGRKGIIFTAKYVERFNKMETVLRNQLITNQNFLVEHFNVLLGTLTEKVNRLEAQAEFNHRPSHATKLNWNKVIKTYAKCQADEENIKYLVFAKFSISKWEDLTADRFSEVFGYIREIAEKANLINQVSLFDSERGA